MARKLTPAQKKAAAGKFLKAYASNCNVRRACRAAGIGVTAVYRWLKINPRYAEKFQRIRQHAGDYLEDVAIDRATDGWKEPVFYQGAVCGHITKFSDALLMQLLRGFKPEKYGVQRQEISGPDKAPIQARIEIVFVRPGDNPGSSPE